MRGPKQRKRLTPESLWHREFRCHFCLHAALARRAAVQTSVGGNGRRFFGYAVNRLELFLHSVEKMILKSVSLL